MLKQNRHNFLQTAPTRNMNWWIFTNLRLRILIYSLLQQKLHRLYPPFLNSIMKSIKLLIWSQISYIDSFLAQYRRIQDLLNLISSSILSSFKEIFNCQLIWFFSFSHLLYSRCYFLRCELLVIACIAKSRVGIVFLHAYFLGIVTNTHVILKLSKLELMKSCVFGCIRNVLRGLHLCLSQFVNYMHVVIWNGGYEVLNLR